MKKITLFVKDEVIDTYRGVFSSMEDFKILQEMPEMLKMLMMFEGSSYFDKVTDIDKLKDKDLLEHAKNKILYGAFQDMIILAENLIDLKVENIDK